MTVRLGFIGGGAVASRHARTLESMPECQVVAVAETNAERAFCFAERFGCLGFTSHHDMLSACELDAVYVCVPPANHGSIETVLVDARLPFFVEKPLAAGWDPSLSELADRVQRCGITTSVGYHLRYLDTTNLLKSELAGRSVRLVSICWLDRMQPRAWWPQRQRSGGQVVEQVTHLIDLARYLIGEVSELQGMLFSPAPMDLADTDIDVASVASVKYDSGAIGVVYASCVLNDRVSASIELVADGFYARWTEGGLTLLRDDISEDVTPRVDSRTAADRSFIRKLAGDSGEVILSPYEDAVRSHQAACAIATGESEIMN